MKSMLCIATFLFLLTGAAAGQETRGSITGRVTDRSGGVVRDAKVEATNLASGVTVSSVTNESGSYEIPYLQPGKYRVAVLAQGFNKLVRENIELRVNDRLKLDFTLEVGTLTETITVSDSNTLVEAATASVGNVIGGRQTTELPIDGRQKAFWSFGYEGVLVRRETTFTGTVPTLKQRQGDFSELLALGSQYQIYDPATIRAEPNGRFSRQPFAGNLIPANRLDPVAKAILAFYPQPNTPGTVDGRQNYFRIAPQERLWQSYLARLDYNLSERHRAFVRYNANTFWNTTQNIPTEADGSRDERPGSGFVFDDVYVFNPQLLLNVRYGLTYQNPVTTRTFGLKFLF
jgi:hypothetical protein